LSAVTAALASLARPVRPPPARQAAARPVSARLAPARACFRSGLIAVQARARTPRLVSCLAMIIRCWVPAGVPL